MFFLSCYRLLAVLGISFLIAAVGAPVAIADPITYMINFTNGPTSQAGNVLPTSGMFTYDPATEKFSSFTVTWENVVIDMTFSANDPLQWVANGPACALGPASGAQGFNALSTCNPPVAGGRTDWIANYPPGTVDANFYFQAFDSIGQVLIYSGAAWTGTPDPATSSGLFSITPEVAQTPEPKFVALVLFGLVVLGSQLVKLKKRDPATFG
jgi:hypothetical protein